MKSILHLCLFCLFFSNLFFAQDNEKKKDIVKVSHTVALGETMLMISKKYFVEPTEIYRENKQAVNGLTEGMVLQIPIPADSPYLKKMNNKKKEVEINEKITKTDTKVNVNESKTAVSSIQFKDYVVQSGETAYSIAKANNLKTVQILENNPIITEKGLQEGMTIKIPVLQKNSMPTYNLDSNKNYTDHIVNQGETITSISKNYGISISEIERVNKDFLQNGLKQGNILKIPVKSISNQNTPEISENDLVHIVQKGDTLFSISKKYGITIDELKKKNEVLKNEILKEGMTLNISKK